MHPDPSATSASRPRLKLKLRWLPYACVALTLLAIVFPYRGWVLLDLALGGVWLLGWLWARSLAQGLRLSRAMRYGWAQVGDRIEERFTLVNESWLPALWFDVIDRSTLPDYQAGRASGVGAQSTASWRVQDTCTRRGLFTLGPAQLRSGDPLGVYTLTLDLPATASIVVMPPVVALPSIEVAAGGRLREGRRTASGWTPSVSSARVRAYLPGDSARSIHWPTSAHRDELFVRLYDHAPSGDWWIILDLDRAQHAGEGQQSTLEHAVILAASLADKGLRLGHAVGLSAYGASPVWLPARPAEAQRWEILRALTTITLGSRSLAEVIAQGKLPPQASSIIVITPAVAGAWLGSLLGALRAGSAATVLLLDRSSFGGDGEPAGTLSALAEQGIAHSLVRRELLDQPSGQAGKRGQWEWRIGGTGRAIAVAEPADEEWQALA